MSLSAGKTDDAKAIEDAGRHGIVADDAVRFTVCFACFGIGPKPMIVGTAVGEAVSHGNSVTFELAARVRQISYARNTAHSRSQPDRLHVSCYLINAHRQVQQPAIAACQSIMVL